MTSTTRAFHILCFCRLAATGSVLENMFLKKVFWELPGEICSQNPWKIPMENCIFSEVAG